MSYRNKAVMTMNEEETKLEWAESGVYGKEGNSWRMALLHSTVIKPAGM